ncbi:tRNA (guanosine(46)-N7)-methyltransferase TrmB [Alkalihalobacillus pseudalcaliphilus]|uniref:tRNA (guanosine(46)-N7)-methyltransferase TrmB n=1 Tax=Alkalihalobacillus pseudalcaliphilus TaxID=79884 RepID=UPI00064D84D2|nr:tRNA (guanosine(46)-N7)-methyltransferase TrmB [Alkalihalobacillus pseudalcaliphilus]KMK77798.1 tRNA (guanine-N7)-methyltransferase [Alkalihalobacillus pseudalcaliphilus]
MRLRHKPWAKEEMEKNPNIVIQNPSRVKGKWSELFGNHHPIYVEVGTGKGQFLLGMGQAHPNVNFIGIEKYDSVLITAMERVKEAGLSNVVFLNEDVEEILDFFGEGEINRFFINFTDPWPKNRHEKRRLTYQSFLEKYELLLKEQGEIHFKTDNQGLFEYSLHSFSKYGLILNHVSLDLHNSNFEGNVMTEYEQKFHERNMRIYRCEAVFRQK